MKKAFLYSLLAFLVVVSAVFFFGLKPSEKPYRLTFDESRDVNLEFAFALDHASTKPYKINGNIVAQPQAMPGGTLFRCFLQKLEIYDEDLVLRFEKKANQEIHYVTNPRLTEEQRRDVFAAFNIDLKNSETASDNSLLNQPFSCFVNDKAQIQEFVLTASTRNAIYKLRTQSEAISILLEFLSHPNKIPGLLPSNTLTTWWKTSGSFLGSLNFMHHIENSDNDNISIRTQSTSSSHKQDIDHSWNLLWNYNTATQSITQVLFEVSFLKSASKYSRTNKPYITLKGDLKLNPA